MGFSGPNMTDYSNGNKFTGDDELKTFVVS